MPALYAAPAGPDAPEMITKTPYDQPPTPSDGPFYPIYPEFYDFGSSAGHSAAPAAVAACGGVIFGGGGGGAGGQHPPDFSAMCQTEGDYPPGWDYGLLDGELPFASPQDLIGGEGPQRQPQAPWGDYAAQTYPVMTGGQGAAASDGHAAHYLPGEEEPAGGCYEPPPVGWWRPPPLGQISPSPSQSSYYASSPASAGGAQFSRHNSCSSLPASSVAAAVEQARLGARFQPAREQALSPGDRQPNPPGKAAAQGSNPGAEPSSSPSTGQRPGPRGSARDQATAAAATRRSTTDYSAGTVTPAFTPSPKDSAAAAIPHRQQAPQSARHPPDQQQAPKSSSGKRAPPPPPARQAAQKKKKQQAETAQGGQAQQAQQQAQPAAPAQRARNRTAANKCRAKTKLAVADLESTERAMGAEHRELSATARGLRDEVLLLKNELLAHGGCDDALIQQYLTNQARIVGGGAVLPPAAAGSLQHQPPAGRRHLGA